MCRVAASCAGSWLKQQATRLAEARSHQLCAGIARRDQDLTTARTANRELMARL
ncbi:MAG TPA: hypothetical protein VF060_04805 [Trebonia sp.]